MLAIIKESTGHKLFLWSDPSKPDTVRLHHTDRVKYPNTYELSLDLATRFVGMVQDIGHVCGYAVERYDPQTK